MEKITSVNVDYDSVEILKNCFKRIETVFLLPLIVEQLKSEGQTVCQIKLIDGLCRNLDKEVCSIETDKKFKIIDDLRLRQAKHFPALKNQLSDEIKRFLFLFENCVDYFRKEFVMSDNLSQFESAEPDPEIIQNQNQLKIIGHLTQEISDKTNQLTGLRQQDELDQIEFEEKMRNLQLSTDKIITKIIDGSHYQMKKYHDESEEKIEFLRKQLDLKRKEYDDFLQKLSIEQELMQKNVTNLQSELENVIKKYDRVISIEYSTVEHHVDLVKSQNEVYRKLLNEFDQQTKIFDDIVEKELAENRIRDEKVALFTHNRSAKVIQRAYKRSRSKFGKKKKVTKNGGAVKKGKEAKKKALPKK